MVKAVMNVLNEMHWYEYGVTDCNMDKRLVIDQMYGYTHGVCSMVSEAWGDVLGVIWERWHAHMVFGNSFDYTTLIDMALNNTKPKDFLKVLQGEVGNAYK